MCELSVASSCGAGLMTFTPDPHTVYVRVHTEPEPGSYMQAFVEISRDSFSQLLLTPPILSEDQLKNYAHDVFTLMAGFVAATLIPLEESMFLFAVRELVAVELQSTSPEKIAETSDYTLWLAPSRHGSGISATVFTELLPEDD